MSPQFSIIVLVPMLTSLVLLAMAYYAWLRRASNATIPFVTLLLGLAL